MLQQHGSDGCSFASHRAEQSSCEAADLYFDSARLLLAASGLRLAVSLLHELTCLSTVIVLNVIVLVVVVIDASDANCYDYPDVIL